MGKLELEVKVLNIKEDEVIQRILDNGGELKEESNQILYTYDLSSLYSRYVDIVVLLNEYQKENMENKQIAQMERLKLLFFEMDQLCNQEERQNLKKITGKEKLKDLLEQDTNELLAILNKKEFQEFMSQFHNNSKKWVRLRKTNHKVTLTVKHILADNDTKIQQMLETEMEVPSIEAANDFLEALGFAYKSYQEKRRKTYRLNGCEIDIDTWPMLNTYMEIEGKNEEEIEKILNLFGYCLKDTISCTVDEIYKKQGIDSLRMREIKFE